MTQIEKEHGGKGLLRASADCSQNPSLACPATTGSGRGGPGVPRRRRRLHELPTKFPELLPLARRLEALRLERGLTQGALAARASISGNHYQEIAYARTNPTITVVMRLAAALDVSLANVCDPVGTATGEERRSVQVGDLEALVAAHRRLLNAVKRVAHEEQAAMDFDERDEP